MLHSNGLNGIECAEYNLDFIDTAQYWERTGGECGDDMPVWYRFVRHDGGGKPFKFKLKRYGDVKGRYSGLEGIVCMVIVNELGRPPKMTGLIAYRNLTTGLRIIPMANMRYFISRILDMEVA
jgi:hypothetical protein